MYAFAYIGFDKKITNKDTLCNTQYRINYTAYVDCGTCMMLLNKNV